MAHRHGLDVVSFPMSDYFAPADPTKLHECLTRVLDLLKDKKNGTSRSIRLSHSLFDGRHVNA